MSHLTPLVHWSTNLRRALSLAIRSLRARPLRTILTIFGVVLGVAVILAISTTNLSTLDAITAVFSQASGKAHLVVNSADSSAQGFPEEALDRIESVSGVAARVPVLREQALLADETSPTQVDISFFGVVSGGLAIYGIDPTLDVQAREYKMVEGRFLSPDRRAYDIVLVKNYADEKEIRLGNEVALSTPGGVVQLRVVGLMDKDGPGQLNNGAFGVIPLEAAQDVFRRAGDLDQIDVVASPETASGPALERLRTTLQARLGAKYAVTYPAAQGKRVSQMLSGYQMGLNMFSAIAIFVGAFLVYNAFSMTVVERTREIGMLRALGMTRQQVMGQILTEAAIIGVVGSGLGIAAGIGLAQGLVRVMELVVAQEVKQARVPASGLLTALGVGMGVTLVAAAVPAWQASRISPLEALRIRSNVREGWFVRRGWIAGVGLLVVSLLVLIVAPFPAALQEKMQDMMIMNLLLGATLLIPAAVDGAERAVRPVLRRVYGNEGQLGSRNVRRARLRTALTVAALMIGVAMVLSIRTITAAFGQDIRTWIERYIGGDVYVHSSLNMRADLARRLAEVEGVSAVTPIRYLDVKRVTPDGKDELLALMAVDPLSYRDVTSFVFSGEQGDPAALANRLADGDAVFVSSVLAEKYGLRQGDTVRLATRRGTHDFEIAAVVVDFYNQGMVIQASWKDLRRYFGLNDVSAFLLKVGTGQSPREVRDRIDQLYSRSNHITVESNEAIRSRALGLIRQTTSLFDVMSIITMIVAALGVINTLTMNVVERTREIGMLRGLGMTRRQVAKMILAEAGMMGLVGGAFGLAFGILMSRTVLGSINRMSGFKLDFILPAQGVIVSLVIALVISQVAALWPAQRAARVRIIEAIQFE
jgi:putative ABC transport system permease protein